MLPDYHEILVDKNNIDTKYIHGICADLDGLKLTVAVPLLLNLLDVVTSWADAENPWPLSLELGSTTECWLEFCDLLCITWLPTDDVSGDRQFGCGTLKELEMLK